MFKKLENEKKFILSIVAPVNLERKERTTLNKVEMSSLDWKTVTSLLHIYEITPLFYKEINKLYKIKKYIPIFELEKWAYLTNKNQARNFIIAQETKLLARLLSDSNISVIILKGTELAKDVFMTYDGKVITDIDILVELKNIKSASDLLIENDFIPPYKIFPNGFFYQYRHHFVFKKKAKKVLVELHWNIAQPISYRIKEEDIWKESINVNEKNYNIKKLNLEFNFILLLIQFQRHNFKSLKNFIDFSWFTEKFHSCFKEDILIGYLKKYGLMGSCFFTLNLMNKYFGIDIPLKWYIKRERFHTGQKLSFIFFNHNHFNTLKPHHFFQHIFTTLLKDSWKHILFFYRKKYFPPSDFLSGVYQVEIQRKFLFLYYLKYYFGIFKNLTNDNLSSFRHYRSR